MTKDDIIRMAREAGFAGCENYSGGWKVNMMRFAELVADAKRKECAMACKKISADQWALFKGRAPYSGQEPERASDLTQGKSDGADLCFDAIMAMGQA